MSHYPNSSSLRLFLFGFLTLFLELILIRYLAGNVYNLGYFPNLVLLGVFIGMGMGFVFHRRLSENRSRQLFNWGIGLLLVLVVLVYFGRPAVPGFSSFSGVVGGEVFFTSIPRSAERSDLFALVVFFLLIIALFSLISQRTAKYFIKFPPLKAYSLDIGGSCCGILSFMLLSWLQLPAFVWFGLTIPVILFLQEPDSKNLRFTLAILLPFVVVFAWQQDARLLSVPAYDGFFEVKWSPYQKVEIATGFDSPAIFVNGILHQVITRSEDLPNSFYARPYRYRQENGLHTRNVMIIGAGSGSDVAAALLNGVKHVDAVEIDPVLADLGKRYNPARPYSDPHVNVVINDGRAFLTSTSRKYDLIVFALTDSLVKASAMSQLRLENYLFTKESVKRAFGLLTGEGQLVFYNYYRFPFIQEKIKAMIFEATGRFPTTIYEQQDFAMIVVGAEFKTPAVANTAGVSIPTDDWPFLYLSERTIPPIYAKAMIGLALAVLLLGTLLQYANRANADENSLSLKLVFLFMGIAFLLLETKSVIQFSLLFGTTWKNTSLVFLAVLSSVLLANWVARGVQGTSLLPIAFVLLMLVCTFVLFVPMGTLLGIRSGFLRFIVASVLTFSPIFFANLIFSLTFRDQNLAENLFGWNLIGAAMGGILEYTSMWLGYGALAVLVMICYTIVIVFLRVARAGNVEPALNAG